MFAIKRLVRALSATAGLHVLRAAAVPELGSHIPNPIPPQHRGGMIPVARSPADEAWLRGDEEAEEIALIAVLHA